MTDTTKLKTFMHRELVDAMDYSLSPGDGIEAINGVFTYLPRLHQAKFPRHGRRRTDRKTLKLFRGEFDWIDIGFSYVQLGQELHVIELWTDEYWNQPDRPEVDVIVPDESGC